MVGLCLALCPSYSVLQVLYSLYHRLQCCGVLDDLPVTAFCRARPGHWAIWVRVILARPLDCHVTWHLSGFLTGGGGGDGDGALPRAKCML